MSVFFFCLSFCEGVKFFLNFECLEVVWIFVKFAEKSDWVVFLCIQFSSLIISTIEKKLIHYFS